MDRWQAAREQLRALVGSLTTAQKWSLVAAAVVTVVGLIWLINASSQPPYRVLYADLAEGTAQEITEALEARGIPYRRESSTSLSVPQDRLYEARMHVAGAGLVGAQGKGYELFDRADFGMTSFSQQVNYQRAKENELARTIRYLDTVRDVRVHLVMPEESLFRSEQREPSASVVLTLERGLSPDAHQISSIQHLVASAVDRLAFYQVTVVDSTGQLLARPRGEGGGIGSGGGVDSFEVAQRLERELEERITRLLSPLMGPNSLETIVRVELSTAQIVETSEEYDPDQVAIRSEQRSEDLSQRMEPVPVGGAGVANNLADTGGVDQPDELQQRRSGTSETLNYEINRIVRHTTHQGGKVERISVAVLLDEKLMIPRLEAEGVEGGEEMMEQQLEMRRETIERLVKRAVGFDAARGDTVEVSYGTFQALELSGSGAEPWYLRPDLLTTLGRFLLYLLLAVLLFVFVVRPAVQVLVPEDTSQGRGRLVGKTVAELKRQYEQEALEAEPEPEFVQPAYVQLREEILQLTAEDPERTGRLLRHWIRTNQ